MTQGKQIGDAMKGLILRRHIKDGLSTRQLSALFGVSPSHISKVIREKKEEKGGLNER